MRRLFLLLLLCLLPLQISWGAVADYCGHESGKASQHFGHHADEHKASFGANDDGKQGNSSPGDDHCHLSGFLGILGAFAPVTHEYAQPTPRESDGTYPSVAAYPPERPQWSVPA